MGDNLLLIVGISIVIAAVIGMRSGITTAFLEIVAGLIIGQYFDIFASDFMTIMAGLGVVTLMFMAGLEVDFRFLRQKFKESATVGVVSYTLPFIVIFLATGLLFELTDKQALLFAIALSTSSAGTIYTVLRQKGPLGERRRMILSAVMVMEFLSMALLAIFFTTISLSVILVVLFIVLAGLLLPRLQRRFHLFREETQENIAIKVILALLLIAQFLSHESGVDVILIAFTLGMVLAEFVSSHSTLKKEVEAIGFGFLTPIFFFSVGASLSPAQLLANSWVIAAIVVIAFVPTFAATYMIAKKHFPRRARVMAILFNDPLSVGIVAATIGFEKEVIDAQQYGILVGVVVVMSFIALVFGKYPDQKSSLPEKA